MTSFNQMVWPDESTVFKNFTTFIEEASRWCELTFSKHSDVFKEFENFTMFVKTHTEREANKISANGF